MGEHTFLVDLSGNQSVTTITFTQVNFNNTVFDTDSNYSPGKFTASLDGYYHFDAGLRCNANVFSCQIDLRKNGVSQVLNNKTEVSNGQNEGDVNLSVNLQLTTGDYVEIFGYNDGVVAPSFEGNTRATYFSGHLIGAGSGGITNTTVLQNPILKLTSDHTGILAIILLGLILINFFIKKHEY